MQIHFVQNVQFAVHSSIFERNKVRISISEQRVCVLCTVGVYKRAHIAVTFHVSYIATADGETDRHTAH